MNALSGIRTVSDLAARVRANPELAKKLREDPEVVMQEAAALTLPDTWIYRGAVIAVAIALFTTLAAGVLLEIENNGAPNWLIAAASTAIGALAGMLRNR